MEILCVDDNSVGSIGGTKSVADSFTFTILGNTAPSFDSEQPD